MTTAVEKAPAKVAAPARRLGFARMEELLRDVERFWERSMITPFDLLRRETELRLPELDWSPRVDLWEKDGDMMLRADLPGMKKDDVEIYFEEGDLVLRGERRETKERKENDQYRSECFYGSFYRRIPLGFEIDPKLVHAKLDNGVLELRLPIPAKAKHEPKRIPVL
jgi:HSP20 family protein